MVPKKQLEPTSYSNRLAIRLRALRLEAELTAPQLCSLIEKAGYPLAEQTLFGWENGKRQIALDAIPAIAKAFKLKIAELMPPK